MEILQHIHRRQFKKCCRKIIYDNKILRFLKKLPKRKGKRPHAGVFNNDFKRMLAIPFRILN